MYTTTLFDKHDNAVRLPRVKDLWKMGKSRLGPFTRATGANNV